MTLLIYIGLAGYLMFVVLLMVLWDRASSKKTIPTHEFSRFSIVVPIRNEAANIAQLLLDLEAQRYPKNQFEILIVDDHSEDDSVQVIDDLKVTLSANIKLLKLPENKFGKKRAIEMGVERASFDTIITTDGDCRVLPDWLICINRNYSNGKVMVFGGVALSPLNTFFDYFQALELSALIATGASMHVLNLPGMCNGANFSFKRHVFYEVDGYRGNENLPGGDDEFLLRKVRKKYPRGVTFMRDEHGVVCTAAANSAKAFFNQKVRWASKWKQHTDAPTKILGLLVFGLNLLIALGIVLAFPEQFSIIHISGFIAGKVLLELTLALRVLCQKLSMKMLLSSMLTSLIYPFYTIVMGLCSLKGNYSWKGRTY